MAKKTVEQQVAELNQRTTEAMAVTRFLARVQVEQLAKAEELRLAVKDLMKSRWQHRCSDKVGGCTAVSDAKMKKVVAILKQTPKFHVNRKIPKALQELLA